MIRACWSYWLYLLRHKAVVFIECCRLGIPWRGLVHDLSKFRPDEFLAHARFFFGGRREQDRPALDLAWCRHQRRNPHHYQAWLAIAEDGTVTRLPMPDRYRREMLADWKARAADGKETLGQWWLRHPWRDHLHPETYEWLRGRIMAEIQGHLERQRRTA